MRFKEHYYIVEGGNAVADVGPILSEYQKPTFENLEKEILKGIFQLDDGDYSPLGSTFKKKKGQGSGDIDVAVSEKKIADNFNIEPKEVLSFINDEIIKKFPDMSIKKMPGLGIVSIAFPITTDKGTEEGKVQVDFMLSDNVSFSNFMFHSPDFSKDESQYKGLFRTELLKSIFSAVPIEEMSKRFEDEFDGKFKGDIKELGRRLIDIRKGLKYQVKDFTGKKGKVKTGKTISSEHITANPEEIVTTALGDTATLKDVNSFETVWAAMQKPTFPFKNDLQTIVDYFVDLLGTKGLDVPEEIKNSKYYKGDE